MHIHLEMQWKIQTSRMAEQAVLQRLHTVETISEWSLMATNANDVSYGMVQLPFRMG